MQAVSLQTGRKNSRVWLFNPFADLLFACGGLYWFLVGLHFCFSSFFHTGVWVMQPFEIMILFWGNIVISNSHLASTQFRLYKEKLTRNRLWFYSYASVVLLPVLLIASFLNPVFFSCLVLVFIAFQVDHTLSQNYGVCLFYCYRDSFSFSQLEKSLFKLIHHLLAWYAILRTVTYLSFMPTDALGIELPLPARLPEAYCNVLAFALFISVALLFVLLVLKAQKTEKQMPWPAQILFLTSLLMYSANDWLTPVLFVFIPIFHHATQYLLISTFFNSRECQSKAEMDRMQVSSSILFNRLSLWVNLKYWAALLFLSSIGLLLFPYLLSQIFATPFLKSAAITMVCLSFHHFFADRELWRFRDKKVRDLVLETN